ncbi:VOC family protein [Rhizobium sp. AN70]|uniref:VOC family protein n=2 Tax=unclassified Rhizobium TaxID=2613769 RepID=UPI00247B266B|nr:VOC family protein [Rhizobium sp. AN70]MDH7804577.1 methylmalonyl-CoA/ethylmalonyl-CoA epimerase [Rhizobium sp. AN70]
MGIFDKLHHICIVVHDAEKTAAYFTTLGVGPWQDYPPLAAYRELGVPSEESFKGLKFKFINLANFQLQLCQPGPEDGPQRRFLDSHGEGVFHLGFDVPDCDEAEKTGLAVGLASLMRGRRDDRSGFTFFDTAEKAGVVLEVRSSPVPARKS